MPAVNILCPIFFTSVLIYRLTSCITFYIIHIRTNVICFEKRGDDIMQDLIKKIRSHMNMNQTEFAELLNVTFATVNRWENGRALPNKLAQDKIHDLFR